MGVEKHLDSSSSASARLNKSHSVDIYRPPALRRNLESIDNDSQVQAQQELQQQEQVPPLQGNDTNCISAQALSNRSETTQSCCNGIGIDTATTSSTSCSNQSRQVRRERRPDRAVYVPRARRSQTTPPAVSTQPQAHLQSAAHQQQAMPVTEINNQLTSLTATSSLSSGTINTTTTTSTSTGTCKSPSGEKSSASNSRRSHKDRASGNGNGARKEKSSSKRLSVDENEKVVPNKSNISMNSNNHNSEEETTAVHSVREPRKHLHRLDKQPPMPVGSVNLNGLSNCNDKNALLVKDCDIPNPKEFPESTNIANSKKSVNSVASEVKKVLPKMTTTSPPTPVPEPFLQPVIAESGGNLRIEDALMTGGERSDKCDRDAEELLRASKEINRSNRRIIKQTFNSDVLEIPEKAVFNSNTSVVKKTAKDDCKNVSTLTSGTDEDDAEEDDWDSMYDDSGDCLDPKILQELTASVGKVKIELPKMDYSAYLTKQSLLNDEEFPHVLEVSNFPVEFKNQDLLMVFSQYKESGFDIKWVDDTHALAVFSSSQVAAEVLAMGHPFVVLKPLAEATVESRLKAKKCSSSLQPYRPRPETCAALARRLVTGALGVRLKTAAQEREIEKRVLREAKERKLLAAKQRDEAWES